MVDKNTLRTENRPYSEKRRFYDSFNETNALNCLNYVAKSTSVQRVLSYHLTSVPCSLPEETVQNSGILALMKMVHGVYFLLSGKPQKNFFY